MNLEYMYISVYAYKLYYIFVEGPNFVMLILIIELNYDGFFLGIFCYNSYSHVPLAL